MFLLERLQMENLGISDKIAFLLPHKIRRTNTSRSKITPVNCQIAFNIVTGNCSIVLLLKRRLMENLGMVGVQAAKYHSYGLKK